MGGPPVTLVGNAHLDPVWLWRWPEGLSEGRATFASALERICEYPDFVFTAGGAAVYRWIERTAPELFAEIRRRVSEGRWSVVGGWQTQSDCNLPSGESFARNALYSQRWFREKFGLTCRTGYCVDSFGHAGTLPQLLAEGGMRSYVFMRPNERENPGVPRGPFVWEGTDGTRVLGFHLYGGYCCDTAESVERQLGRIREHSPRAAMLLFGVGDHGGGPTKELIELLLARRAAGEPLEFGTADAFFDALESEAAGLPVWKGHMRPHAVGCYSAHSGIKRANRKAEWALLAAERLAAAAALAGAAPAPQQERLAEAWRDLLFCQFHDILAGTSEREACDDALAQLGRAAFSADEVRAEAVQRIGGAVDTRGDGRALLVFNPHAFPVDCLVETDDYFFVRYLQDIDALHVRDASGAVVPHQRVRGSSRTQCPRLVFPARLPALGWRAFRLVVPPPPGGPPPEANPLPGRLECSETRLENDRLRLDIAADGSLRLLDKELGWDALGPGAGAALVLNDPGDTWGHDLTRFDDEAGRFALVSRELVEAGPLRGRLRLRLAFGSSRLTLDFILERFARAMRVDAVLDWREERRLLKLVFPAALDVPVWTTEAPYGEEVRPTDGCETPMGGWTDLSDRDGARGLAVANDSKYSLDARDGALRLTVARSPAYAHHDPHPLGGDDRFLDQGFQEFRLLLIPHGPAWRPEVTRLSGLLNCPPALSQEGTHPGRLPADGPAAIEVAGPAGAAVLKRAEGGGGWVLRLFNPEPRVAECSFAVPALGRSWRGALRGGEVATFLLPDDAGAAVRRTNFLED